MDIAYKLKENHWNDQVTLELELVGARPSSQIEPQPSHSPRVRLSKNSPSGKPALENNPQKTFQYNNRLYLCTLANQGQTLKIENDQGKTLIVQKGQRQGKLEAQTVDVTQPPFFQMIKTAIATLN